jgi:hypothetical protein
MTTDASKPNLRALFVRLQRIRLARLAMRISNLFADLAEVLLPADLRS